MKTFKQQLNESPDRYRLSDGSNKNWMSGWAFGFIGKDFFLEATLPHYEIIRHIFKDSKYTSFENLKPFLTAFNKQVQLNRIDLNKYNKGEFADQLNDLVNEPIENLFGGDGNVHDEVQIPLLNLARFGMKFSGRVWPKEQVISFWFYPKNLKEWNIVKKAIRKKFPIDDTWQIDLSVNQENSSISVGDYEKSNEVKSVKHDLGKIHVMSPIAKKKFLNKVQGFGSDKQAKIARKAGFKSYAEYKAMVSQESKIKSFANFLREKFLDADNFTPKYLGKVIYFETFINPSKSELIKDARGIIDPKGNLYTTNTIDGVIHSDIVKFLIEKGYIKLSGFDFYSLFDKYSDKFLAIKRDGSTNNIYISASYNAGFYYDHADIIEKYISKASKKNSGLNFIPERIQ